MGEVVAEERRRRGEGGARGRQCAAAVGVRERGQPASPGQRPVDARAMLPLAGVEHEGVLRQQRGSPAPSFATQTRVQESLPGQGNAGRQRVGTRVRNRCGVVVVFGVGVGFGEDWSEGEAGQRARPQLRARRVQGKQGQRREGGNGREERQNDVQEGHRGARMYCN